MRLKIIKSGHSFLQKIQLSIIKIMMDQVPGPIAVLSYRRGFFGKHYSAWLQNTMRNMKHWTIGEVELIAAFVSKNNECQFCTGHHVSVAKNVFDEKLILAVLENIDTAPIDTKMKAILHFIKKLTIKPNELTKEDIIPLKKEGLSREAIEEAIHVCGTFSVINRLADAFGFEITPNQHKVGKFLFKNGYGSGSVWG